MECYPYFYLNTSALLMIPLPFNLQIAPSPSYLTH